MKIHKPAKLQETGVKNLMTIYFKIYAQTALRELKSVLRAALIPGSVLCTEVLDEPF